MMFNITYYSDLHNARSFFKTIDVSLPSKVVNCVRTTYLTFFEVKI